MYRESVRMASHHARSILFAMILAMLLGTVAPTARAQDPAVERILRQAERLQSEGQTAAAVGELDLLLRQFPNDLQAPRALLLMANLQRAGGDRAAAQVALEHLLSQHARAPEAAHALNLQADMVLDSARDSQDLSAAQNISRRVPLLFGRESYPVLEARSRARLRSSEISLLLEEPSTAAAELVAALEDEPPDSTRGAVQLALARSWIESGHWQAAAGVLEQAAASPGGIQTEARRLLSLLHRRVLRPLAGQDPWLVRGRFPSAGLDLREPAGVAAAPDGRVLILDSRLPLLVLLAADGRELGRRSLDDLDRPGWLADGRPFVLGSGGVVLPFDATNYAFSDPRKGTPIKNLVTATPGMFGDWFVVGRGMKSVLHVPADGRGRELLTASKPGIVDLARDHLGRIYALDPKAAQIIRMNRDGATETIAVTGDWKRAVALAVDELGYLYVLDRGQRQVSLYDPSGQLMSRVGPDLGNGIELRTPVDIAVDGGGRLLIADSKLPFVVMLD